MFWQEIRRTLFHRWPGHLKSSGLGLLYTLRYKRGCQPDIAGPGFDIVTVVYAPELPLLEIQARSLALFLDPAFSGRIFIIVNDLDPVRVSARIRAHILPRYGRWQSRVHILPYYRLGQGLTVSNGWTFQQALKIAVAKRIERPFYVVLDAKNHAIKPVSTGTFVSSQGRGIQRLFHRHEPLADYTEVCASYFGLTGSVQAPLRPCPPATPFVMHTQSARDLIAYVEQKERRCFFAFFTQTPLLSEFILYGFFLRTIKRDMVHQLYEDGPSRSQTVWPNGWTLRKAMANAARRPEIPFFGVHREILKNLPDGGLGELQAFWRGCGLLRHDEMVRMAAGSGELFSVVPRDYPYWETPLARQ